MVGDGLDQGTRDYLDERFNNIDKTMEAFIKSQEKAEIKADVMQSQISENKEGITMLKSFKEDHITDHQNTTDKKKFSTEMIIIIIIFLADFIKSFFPPP